MAKYSAEEINGRINELGIEDDLKIALMEDIADSILPESTEELDNAIAELNSVKEELAILTEKYKERFLNVSEDKKEEDKVNELEEKEVIDIKEI